MLRRAEPGEEQALLRLLEQEPLFNLHLIDLLTGGLGRQREAWVQEGVWVLARLGGAWYASTLSDPDQLDAVGAASIIDSYSSARVRGLVGPAAPIDMVVPLLHRHRGQVHEQVFATIDHLPEPMCYRGLPRPARKDDLPEIAAMYAGAPAMQASRSAVEAMLPNLWVLEYDGAVTASAAVLAETEVGAMIGAVYTPEEYRGRGYATELVHAMSGTLQLLGRIPCLYYHNRAAGRIYRRIGYRELAAWRAVLF